MHAADTAVCAAGLHSTTSGLVAYDLIGPDIFHATHKQLYQAELLLRKVPHIKSCGHKANRNLNVYASMG